MIIRVSIKKEMTLQDDMKKYWGFYLLRGSTVRSVHRLFYAYQVSHFIVVFMDVEYIKSER